MTSSNTDRLMDCQIQRTLEGYRMVCSDLKSESVFLKLIFTLLFLCVFVKIGRFVIRQLRLRHIDGRQYLGFELRRDVEHSSGVYGSISEQA